MNLAHKIRLSPTKTQEQKFLCACGTSRFTYNWALAECEKTMKTGTFVNAKFIADLKKRWNKEKPSWVYESPRDANAQPFADLSRSFARWNKGVSARPVFKRKHGRKQSFYVANDQFGVKEDWIRLPLIGWVRMAEKLRFSGKIMSATVSCTAGHWFVAINVEVGKDYRRGTTTDKVVGIDLGVKQYATLSTGEVITGTRPYRLLLNRIRRANRSLSRKVLKSSNWVKTKLRLAQLHARVARIRKDFVDKFTTDICRRFGTIRIEDLNVRGMLKMRSLAVGVADQAFYETKRQLVYKSVLFGCKVELIPRFYPSSKICSCCGNVKDDLKLKDRTYECSSCGLLIDRNLNAAYNIAKYAEGLPASACGATSSGRSPFRRRTTKLAVVKQELTNQSSVTELENSTSAPGPSPCGRGRA